jgi:hypothetical protein
MVCLQSLLKYFLYVSDENESQSQAWWCTPVIPELTWETEAGRTQVQDQPGGGGLKKKSILTKKKKGLSLSESYPHGCSVFLYFNKLLFPHHSKKK